MDQLSLSVFIIPSAALLLMVILVVHLKKKAGNQQAFIQLFWRIISFKQKKLNQSKH